MANPASDALGVLDPGDADPRRRALMADWLRLQSELSLSPQRALERLRETPDPGRAWRAEVALPRLDDAAVERALGRLDRLGARLLPWLSPAYPARLGALPDAAPLLAVRGDPASLCRPAAAVVGPRAATAYGLAAARRLAGGLARSGVTVVSGLARGVDAAAHRAALDAGGTTVAVQACGLDRTYPPEHAALADEIAASGAIVTELPLGSPPRAAFFPLRNRLISGLSRVVVVVEARWRSGSLVTARHALDQGVEVMAVPGPIDRATSQGTNRLLRDGAAPALEVEDILGLMGVDPVDRSAAALEAGPGAPSIGPEAQAVLAALETAPATRDELSRRLGRSPSELALVLFELEMSHLIARDRDGRLRAAVPRASPEA